MAVTRTEKRSLPQRDNKGRFVKKTEKETGLLTKAFASLTKTLKSQFVIERKTPKFNPKILEKAQKAANKEAEELGTSLSQKEEKLVTNRIAKQIKEENVLSKMKKAAAQATFKGDKFRAAHLNNQIAKRIRFTKKLEERENKLEGVRESSFGQLIKTSLGPFGSIIGGLGDTMSGVRDQFLAIKEMGARLVSGFKSTISFVGGLFGKNKEKKDPNEEVVEKVDATNNILGNISKSIQSFFNLNKRKNREVIAEKNKLVKANNLAVGGDGDKKKPKKGLFSGIFGKLGFVKKIGAFFAGIPAIFGRFFLKVIPKILGKLAFPLLIITGLIAIVKGAFDSFNDSKSTSLLGKIGDAVLGGLANLLSFFTLGFISKDTIVDTVHNIVSLVSDWFSEKIEVFKDIFGSIWDSLSDGVGEIKDVIFGKIKQVITFVSNTMIKLINGVMEIYAKIASGIGLDSMAAGIRNHKIDLIKTKPPEASKKLEKIQNNSDSIKAASSKANNTVAINAPTNSTNVVNNKNTNGGQELPAPMLSSNRLTVTANALF